MSGLNVNLLQFIILNLPEDKFVPCVNKYLFSTGVPISYIDIECSVSEAIKFLNELINTYLSDLTSSETQNQYLEVLETLHLLSMYYPEKVQDKKTLENDIIEE